MIIHWYCQTNVSDKTIWYIFECCYGLCIIVVYATERRGAWIKMNCFTINTACKMACPHWISNISTVNRWHIARHWHWKVGLQIALESQPSLLLSLFYHCPIISQPLVFATAFLPVFPDCIFHPLPDRIHFHLGTILGVNYPPLSPHLNFRCFFLCVAATSLVGSRLWLGVVTQRNSPPFDTLRQGSARLGVFPPGDTPLTSLT